MKYKNTIRALPVVAILGSINSPVSAAIDWSDMKFSGRIKQGYSVAYDLEDQGSANGPAQYVIEAKNTLRINRNLTFVGSYWLRGDHAPSLDTVEARGIQDFTDTNGAFFDEQFGMSLNEAGSGMPPTPFGDKGKEIRLLDDIDEIIREFSIKYRDSKNRYTVKAGKFQRGWGQSDGLRLLDVLHAQDLRERFAFQDSDALRIPAWMISADFNLKRMGLSGPFEKLGMNDPVVEMVFIPEIQHSKFIINNPTPSDSSSGGIMGLPYPKIIDPKSGFGMPFLGTNLSENTPSDFSIKDAEVGVRIKFESLGGQFSLNAFYGQQDLPVVKFNGGNLVVGHFFNDERAALQTVSLSTDQSIGAIHAPGQYLDFIRSVAAGAPIAFPLEALGCDNPLTPAAEGAPCSVNANFVLDYDYRQKLLGFSFTRDLRELKLGPKQTTPVVRMEFAYEFDKVFNRSIARTPFGETESGSPVLILDSSSNITESDVASLMLGG